MLRILLISAGAILETLFIMRSYRRRDGMSVFLKTAASLVFVLLGLLELRRTGTSVYGELVVAGLTLGMLGDLLLALRYLGQKLHHFFFAAGSVSFFLGHVVYIASVLFMTACAATGAFISSSRALFLFFVGGVCFSASDNMLVVLSFGKDDSPYRNAVLHVLYYMAQIFIALTIEFA